MLAHDNLTKIIYYSLVFFDVSFRFAFFFIDENFKLEYLLSNVSIINIHVIFVIIFQDKLFLFYMVVVGTLILLKHLELCLFKIQILMNYLFENQNLDKLIIFDKNYKYLKNIEIKKDHCRYKFLDILSSFIRLFLNNYERFIKTLFKSKCEFEDKALLESSDNSIFSHLLGIFMFSSVKSIEYKYANKVENDVGDQEEIINIEKQIYNYNKDSNIMLEALKSKFKIFKEMVSSFILNFYFNTSIYSSVQMSRFYEKKQLFNNFKVFINKMSLNLGIKNEKTMHEIEILLKGIQNPDNDYNFEKQSLINNINLICSENFFKDYLRLLDANESKHLKITGSNFFNEFLFQSKKIIDEKKYLLKLMKDIFQMSNTNDEEYDEKVIKDIQEEDKDASLLLNQNLLVNYYKNLLDITKNFFAKLLGLKDEYTFKCKSKFDDRNIIYNSKIKLRNSEKNLNKLHKEPIRKNGSLSSNDIVRQSDNDNKFSSNKTNFMNTAMAETGNSTNVIKEKKISNLDSLKITKLNLKLYFTYENSNKQCEFFLTSKFKNDVYSLLLEENKYLFNYYNSENFGYSNVFHFLFFSKPNDINEIKFSVYNNNFTLSQSYEKVIEKIKPKEELFLSKDVNLTIFGTESVKLKIIDEFRRKYRNNMLIENTEAINLISQSKSQPNLDLNKNLSISFRCSGKTFDSLEINSPHEFEIKHYIKKEIKTSSFDSKNIALKKENCKIDEKYYEQKMENLLLQLGKISHEFKTPLNNISLQLTTVNHIIENFNESFKKLPKSNSKSEDLTKNFLENLNEEIPYLKTLCDYSVLLIEDLNEFNKKEINKSSVLQIKDEKTILYERIKNFILSFDSFDLVECLDFCINIFFYKQKKDNNKSNLSIQKKYDLKGLKTIFMNETKLKQILINLISNSYKFTQNGSVTLKVENLYDKIIKIEVVDTGAGISDEEKKTIFKPYSTIDRNEGMNKHGSGLGLPLVKELLGLLNIDIEVNSKVNVGTNISFNFDLDVLKEIQNNFDNKSYIINKIISEKEDTKNQILNNKYYNEYKNIGNNDDTNSNVINSNIELNKENKYINIITNEEKNRKLSINSNQIFGFNNENSIVEEKNFTESDFNNKKSAINYQEKSFESDSKMDEYKNNSMTSDFFNVIGQTRSASFTSTKTVYKIESSRDFVNINYDEVKQSLKEYADKYNINSNLNLKDNLKLNTVNIENNEKLHDNTKNNQQNKDQSNQNTLKNNTQKNEILTSIHDKIKDKKIDSFRNEFIDIDEKETNIENTLNDNPSLKLLELKIKNSLNSKDNKDNLKIEKSPKENNNKNTLNVTFTKLHSDQSPKRKNQRNLSITNNYLKKISIDSLAKMPSSDPSFNKKDITNNNNENSLKRACTSDLELNIKNDNKRFEKTILKLSNPFTKKESYKTLSNINSSSSGSLKLIHKSSSIMKYSKQTTENFFAVKEENENYGLDSDNSTNLDESIDFTELDGKLIFIF